MEVSIISFTNATSVVVMGSNNITSRLHPNPGCMIRSPGLVPSSICKLCITSSCSDTVTAVPCCLSNMGGKFQPTPKNVFSVIILFVLVEIQLMIALPDQYRKLTQYNGTTMCS